MVAFLKGIPQDVLAKASLRSKAYTRALMHFEAHLLENKQNIQDHLTFLQVAVRPVATPTCLEQHGEIKNQGSIDLPLMSCISVADAVRRHARARRSERSQRPEEGGAVAAGADPGAREHRAAPRRHGLL